MIYHYTKRETIDRILYNCYDSGKKNIILRAGNIHYMNDRTEMELGYEVLKVLLREIEEELNIKDGLRLSTFFTSYGTEQECKQIIMDEMSGYDDTPYVVSFSHDGDSLPMWEMYGDKGRGVCLAFDEELMKLSLVEYELGQYYDVVYKDFSNNKEIKTFWKDTYEQCYGQRTEKFTTNEMVFQIGWLCSVLSPIIKHKCYCYEQEVRVFRSRVGHSEIKHDNMLRPYVEFQFPISILKKIILGPCTFYDTERISLQMKLEACGIVNPQDMIGHSNVPYRLLK